ncbi:MAG: hypothetical protein M3014_02435, partial [Chloroflexota bacterium]|nr:hypothetical protein [Chloroflexota bacterium]
PYYSHSLTGLLTGVLGNGHDALIRIANSAALAAFALLLLYIWRGKWKPGLPAWQGLMSVTLLATMLTDVMLNTHDLSLLVLPGALGLSYLYNAAGSQRRLIAFWCALLWGGYIITSLVSPGQLLAMPIRLVTALVAGALTLLVVRLASGREEEMSGSLVQNQGTFSRKKAVF